MKLFGRRADILGVRGWGHWDPPGRAWTPAPEEVGALHKSRLMYRWVPGVAAHSKQGRELAGLNG